MSCLVLRIYNKEPVYQISSYQERPAYRLQLLLYSFLQTFSSFYCLHLGSYFLSINLEHYYYKTCKSLFMKRRQNKVICDIDASGDCLLVSYHIIFKSSTAKTIL